MIPVSLAAGKWMFVTRDEFDPVKELVAETSQRLSYHTSDSSGLHATYQQRSEAFVPRIELSPILREIKQDQKETNQKLDKVLQELMKR